MALYRTYRPATFADVVGQEHVTDPLSRALDAGRINHAYLFSGPRGCGKTSSARILARSLNCVEGPTSTPCGTCNSCVALAPGGPGNLDVIELDAASHGGVDDTRDLRDRAFYAPAESRYRVFIVDEAHMVTNAGFNALLKIVEEPPEHLIFVFATTEPEKVLPTIRSRTHHYPFRLLAPPVMRALLERICAREGVTVAPEVYPLVIRAGGGSPRDSLSILDQLLAGADDEGVAYDRALALLGVTDVALIDDAIDALAGADGSALFGTVEKVVDAGHDPRRFAVDLLERLRDLILLQAVPDAAERGLVEAPGDQLARMQAQIERLGAASLTRFAETVHTALGEMRGTTSPRLLLEVMCARMLLPAVSADDAALLQRLERLESGVGAPVPAPQKPAEPEPEPKFVRPSQRKAMEEARAAADADRAQAEAAESDSPAPVADEPSAPAGSVPVPEEQSAPAASVPVPEERSAPAASVPVPEERSASGASRRNSDVGEDPSRLAPLAPQGSEGAASSPPQGSEGAASLAPQGSEEDASSPRQGSGESASRAPQGSEESASIAPRGSGESASSHPPGLEGTARPPQGSDTSPAHTPPGTPSAGTMPVRGGGTPTAPQPPARRPLNSAGTPGSEDIPLPDEPVDEYDAPPDDPTVRAPRPAPKPAPEPEPKTTDGLDVESLRRRFQEVRTAVRNHSAQGKTVEAMLSAAVIEDVQADTVVMSHPVEGLVGRLSAPHAVTIIREALQQIFGSAYDVRTVHQAAGAAPAAAPRRDNRPPPRKAQAFSRPSRGREQAESQSAPASEPVAEPDDEPEPPRADEDIPDEERAEMVADVHSGPPERRLDPDQVALELLKSELGARPLE